jgi:large subunit ribosomal protein L21
MYAVIKAGGKQYRVSTGEKLRLERIDAEVGAEVQLSDVLLVGSGDSVKVGTPLVTGVSVTGKIMSHGRGEKVHIFKLRRRKHYQKRQGHRQSYTEVQITAING